MPSFLIVDDEPVLAQNLVKAFAGQGFDIEVANRIADARKLVAAHLPDVALLDFRLPDGNGLDLLVALVREDPELPVIMMTGHGSVADAVRAMQQGARDYVQKPLDLSELRLKVEQALRSRRERREISYYRERGAAPGDIVGESTTTQRLRTLVGRIAQMTPGAGAPAPTVLLLGETGSGKGHTARLLHASGGRRSGPFIEVNCTALPENLAEAELFGHEKGAFTDAKTARAGLFETADGGTIFLDEIGHISLALQAKFMTVIEDRVVRRIGATAARRVDVAVIAATSRDLEAAVRVGEFREDLRQRLNVAVIRVPPLRERDRDPVALARVLLADVCRRYAVAPRTLSPAAEAAIARYAWPGNVRELGNTMERVVLFSDADPVRAEDLDLPASAPGGGGVAVDPGGELKIDVHDQGCSLETVERALLVRALEKEKGNQSAAARRLGISR